LIENDAFFMEVPCGRFPSTFSVNVALPVGF
jgi:hypothetical protein